MATYTYSPDKVLCIIGGVPMSGFADGTGITVEREADAFTKVVGSDGVVSRVKSANRTGSVTITLQQTSASNDILSGFALLDEVSNEGVFPVLIKDNLGRSVFASGEGWVKKIPSSAFGKDISDREWVIDCGKLNIFVGGNTESSVL
jgi:hypothetical protein